MGAEITMMMTMSFCRDVVAGAIRVASSHFHQWVAVSEAEVSAEAAVALGASAEAEVSEAVVPQADGKKDIFSNETVKISLAVFY